jgi:hypothetical protein
VKKNFIALAGGLLFLTLASSAGAQQRHPWSIEIHAGAGDISRATSNPQSDTATRATLKKAIETGAKVLDRGGSSVDAVEPESGPFLTPKEKLNSMPPLWTARR